MISGDASTRRGGPQAGAARCKVRHGNIVHDLGLVDWDMDAAPYPWAVEFDERVKECLLSGNHGDLIGFHVLGRSAAQAVPTLDHYLPMAYVLALQEPREPLAFVHEGIQDASISMRFFQVG